MKWLAVLFFLLLASGGGVVMFEKSRGFRNKNPGNIRKGIDWQGMRPNQTDSAFVQFIDPVYGIRAMNKNHQDILDKIRPDYGTWHYQPLGDHRRKTIP